MIIIYRFNEYSYNSIKRTCSIEWPGLEFFKKSLLNDQTSNGLVGHGGVLQGGGGGSPPQAYLMVGHYCI